MEFAEYSLKEFTEKLASKSPTPGGGSAAGLSAALAAALNKMVITLSSKEDFGDSEQRLTALQKKALQLIDDDAESFDQVMQAFKLSKDTEAEKEKRSQAIQKALVGAAQTPLETMELALELLKFGVKISEKGNVNAVSDAGVSALMALSAVKGGYYNVLINAESFKEQEAAEKLKTKAEKIVKKAEKLAAEIAENTENRIKA